MTSIRPLAVEGGVPAFPAGPPEWPVTTDAIAQSVHDAMASNQWGRYDGQLTAQLQQQLERFCELPHSLMCSSGTIAVELALRGIGVQPGDEVVLAGYDFPGNFRAIEAIGARPVVVDVIPGGWTLDLHQVAAALSGKTRSIIVSHLHGQLADIERVREIVEAFEADRPNTIKILEDVCQMPGGRWRGRPLGTLGDVACFSFGGSKLLSAGRGGAILSQNERLIQRAKIYAHRGNDAFPFSQIQSALLLPQLEPLESAHHIRLKNARTIVTAIEDLEYFSSLTMDEVAADSLPAFYKLPILIEANAPFSRDDFLATIQPEGIAMDIGFRGFTKRVKKRCRAVGDLKNSAVAAAQTVLLHHPILLADDRTVGLLIETLRRCHRYLYRQRYSPPPTMTGQDFI